MARQHCPLVFPDYTARFDYSGKTGQIRLFQKAGVRHPASKIFSNADHFKACYQNMPGDLPYPFPFVMKYDWGGEGQTVSLIQSQEHMDAFLSQALDLERSGLSGFIMQEFVPCRNRVLRVVVIGKRLFSYWRVGTDDARSCVSMASGARIEANTDPDLQHRAVETVRHFASQTKINLAGFDLLYSSRPEEDAPFFLEINYFFGRRGLGGSEAYYALLISEIHNWLDQNGLAVQ